MRLLKKESSKKGAMSLGDTPQAIIVVGTLIIVLAVMALVLSGLRDNTTRAGDPDNATAGFNVTDSGLQGLTNMGNFLPVVGLVVIAAVIIGLLVFFRRGA